MPLNFRRRVLRTRPHGSNWPNNINSFRVHRFQRPYLIIRRSR